MIGDSPVIKLLVKTKARAFRHRNLMPVMLKILELSQELFGP